MAKYPNMVTTKSGLAAIATANAEGKALIFTKIVLGDGDLGETAIADMTDVISRKMELPVTEGTVGSTSGQFQVVALLSNTELLSGFYIKEIAAFAKVGDDGTETLIAYTNGGAYVDYLPDKETPINSQNVILDVLVGNAESVTIAVKDETLVSQKNLSDAISNHNDDDSAHAHLLSGSNFGTAVLNHLLGSALASLVTAVSTDSLFSKLLKKALEAAGLQYNIASNGYICFGALFGGLILQWGKLLFTANQQMQTVTLPITMNVFLSAAFSATSNALQNAFSFYNTGGNYTETFEIGVNGTVSSSQIVMCRYIIIGY